ncbi:MAG: GAF domain-containing protein [Anaerolineae bacterium]|jgi:PAS domain S-box-containing protein|nr:GAF domain-containing protein [Anaerolineae bacterium]MDH7475313.1 histidine kinase N-terminal 7TM domain-containing protein [Anaerolineae bacterium]
MNWKYTPYVLPLFVAAVVSVALAVYAWRHRGTRGATAFVVLMLAIVEWLLGYALELGSTTLPAKVFWAKVEYLGIAILPLSLLVFILQYTGHERWLSFRNLALLAVVPACTLLLVWTNQAHGLVWTSTRLDASGPFPVLDMDYGLWFWVHLTYAYLLLLLGTIWLIAAFLRSLSLSRRQSGVLLIGVLFPWVSNGLYLAGLSPIPNLDLTPFAFVASGIAFAWGLFAFRLLDVLPVAYKSVVESIDDGVIVLSAQDYILDLNPAARRMIGVSAAEAVGKPAVQVLTAYADLVKRFDSSLEAHTEITLDFPSGSGTEAQGGRKNLYHYELHISPLTDQRGNLLGRVVVLHDVTVRQQAEEALRQAHHELEKQVQERTASLTRRIRDLEALTEVARGATTVLDLQTLLARVVTLISERFGFYHTAIFLLDETGQFAVLQAASSEGGRRLLTRKHRLPVGEKGIVSHVTSQGKPYIAVDVANDITFLSNPDLPATRSELGLPLRVGDKILGVLDVQSMEPDAFSDEDVAVLQTLADQVAIAIDNAQLFKQIQARVEELAVLNEMGRVLTMIPTVDEVLEHAYHLASRLIDTTNFYVALYDVDQDEISFPLYVEEKQARFHIGKRHAGNGITEYVIRTRQPLLMEENVSQRAKELGIEPVGREAQSWLGVPMMIGDQVIGVIAVQSHATSRLYNKRHCELLVSIANQVAIAIANARLHEQAQQELAERQRAEEALQTYAAKLEQSNRELEGFAYIASHDLQEPLRKVQAFGDLLQAKYGAELGDQGRDYLARMQNATRRMQTLINDLLTYSRVTTKAQPFTPVDLALIVREVMADLEMRIQEVGGRVEVSELPTIEADPTQMRQLFQNLIGNALKFHKRDEAPLVRVYAEPRDSQGCRSDERFSAEGCYRIMVEDNGIGFDERYLDRIFQVFQRLHGRDEYEGSGIGLATCRKIVERHGGSITARSVPGQGATFIVTLPAKQH